ncbi:GNAT family N-acetyltransferase [Clostridium sp. Marseille-Q7071]
MVKLEYLLEEDFDKIIKWNENTSPEYLMQWAGPTYKHPITKDQIAENFKNISDKEESQVFIYKIIYTESNEIIGTIQLIKTDNANKVGRIVRFLIGEESIRGKGIGTAAIDEILNIGFNTFLLEEITLGVFDFNHGAIRCYEKVGFKKTKITENARVVGNKYWNLYEMSIKKNEWLKMKK